MKRNAVRLMPLCFMLLCLMSVCGGCGRTVPDTESGGYVEQGISFSDETEKYAGVVAGEGTIRLIREEGEDLISQDGGGTFREDENVPWAFVRPGDDRLFCVTPEGDRLCRRGLGGDISWVLFTHDGRQLRLEELGEEAYCACCGGGYLYLNQGHRIYRVDPTDGETEFFAESPVYPSYMAADSRFLYVVTYGIGLTLYEAETGRAAAEQDEKLSDFVAQSYKNGLWYDFFILYPCGDSVYALTYQGIYRHELYGDEIRQMIDGGRCGIGDVSRYFRGMAVTEGKSGTEFWVCYSDGCLMRYVREAPLAPAAGASMGTYDRMESVKEIQGVEELFMLRVYSLYGDGNVRQAIHAFRQQYPDIYVRYEVGVDLNQGITREEALQRLEEELEAGTGPDILLMDDLPYEAYLEAGVLADLSGIRAQMTEEEYFLQVIDGLAETEGLYVMPAAFALPILYGEKETIAAAESLEDLARMTEEAGGEMPEGTVFAFLSPEETLRLLAQSCQGAWMKEGELDRAAVADFFTQAKRIYEARAAGRGRQTYRPCVLGFGIGENVLERRFGYAAIAVNAVQETAWCGELFGSGFVTGGGMGRVSGGGVNNDFAELIALLNRLQMDLCYLPGQCRGSCLAETLLAVNEASARKEESLLFVEYALSYAFQRTPLNGTPVNRKAYEAMKRQRGKWYVDSYGSGITRRDGTWDTWIVRWPEGKDWERLDMLIQGISGVNRCDIRVYEAVVEAGSAVLAGEMDEQAAVRAVEKRIGRRPEAAEEVGHEDSGL